VGFSATAGHTPLPGRSGANGSSLGVIGCNPTSKRTETATAHTGRRWQQVIHTLRHEQYLLKD